MLRRLELPYSIADLADAHGRWRTSDGRSLGIDRLEVYERIREA